MFVSTPSARAVTGPLTQAAGELQSTQYLINGQINYIRNALTQLIATLEKQQKDADTQRTDLLQKQQLIATSNTSLTAANKQTNQNKLLPKDVKDPLNQMFDSSAALLDEMGVVIAKGIKTTRDIDVLVPDVVTKIKKVVQDIDTYSQIVKNAMDSASRIVNPLAQAESNAINAGQAVQQGTQQAAQTIVHTAEQTGQAIKQAGEQTGQAIVRTSEQAGQTIKQGGEQAGQGIVHAAEAVGQGLKDFGKLLGL